MNSEKLNRKIVLTHHMIEEMSEQHDERALLFVGVWQVSNLPTYFEQMRKECIDLIKVVMINLEDSIIDVPLDSNSANEVVQDKDTVQRLLNEYDVVALPVAYHLTSKQEITFPVSLASIESVSTPSEHFHEKAIESYQSFMLNEAVRYFLLELTGHPDKTDDLFNLASLFHMTGYWKLSIPYLESILQANPSDSTAYSLLWIIAQDELCKNRCISVYRRLADNGDPIAAQKYATLTGEGQLNTSCDPMYVRLLYDQMADSFENKLVDSLDYKAPWLYREMIEKYLANDLSKYVYRCLDLGCGSGLVGRVFRKTISVDDDVISVTSLLASNNEDIEKAIVASSQDESALIGIDVSPKIAAIAANHNTYDVVGVADINEVLSMSVNNNISYNIIIASDTFIYVGGLYDIFQKVSKLLKPPGIFAFSTEDLDLSTMKSTLFTNEVPNEDTRLDYIQNSQVTSEPPLAVPGWGVQLLSSSRFGHAKVYVLTLAKKFNFNIVEEQSVVLRLESAVPIYGVLYMLVLQ